MTENKRFKYSSSLEKVYDCDSFNGETTESYGTFECCDMLNQLNDENEQLKKRNNNQYNQLSELWGIIEEENWEKLIAMKKQLKEDEERLQKEWVCYE